MSFVFIFFSSFFKSWIQEIHAWLVAWNDLAFCGQHEVAWDQSLNFFSLINSWIWFCFVFISATTPLPTSPNKSLFLKGSKQLLIQQQWYFPCFFLNILRHCVHVCIVNNSFGRQYLCLRYSDIQHLYAFV